MKEVYGVSPEKIDLIPHGVPDVQFIDPSFHKDQFGVEGKTMLLTFGLLSPNKGIEYVIEALPAILKRASECRLHRPWCDTSQSSFAGR